MKMQIGFLKALQRYTIESVYVKPIVSLLEKQLSDFFQRTTYDLKSLHDVCQFDKCVDGRTFRITVRYMGAEGEPEYGNDSRYAQKFITKDEALYLSEEEQEYFTK